MMKAEGADALTYGDPQGYRGMRELVCHKYQLFENLHVTPDNIFVANGSGAALALAFSAFVDPGDPIICEAPTFSARSTTSGATPRDHQRGRSTPTAWTSPRSRGTRAAASAGPPFAS